MLVFQPLTLRESDEFDLANFTSETLAAPIFFFRNFSFYLKGQCLKDIKTIGEIGATVY